MEERIQQISDELDFLVHEAHEAGDREKARQLLNVAIQLQEILDPK